MAKYTIDRFEGEQAVLLFKDDETIQHSVSKQQLPDGVKEGDILNLTIKPDGQVVMAEVLKEETEEAKRTAQTLLEKLKRKNS